MSGATAPAGWEGILDPGERILWQGRPVPGIVWRPQQMVTFLFGLAFAGFALFWMLMAATAGGFFWMFGLIHFGVGLALSFGPIVWPAYMRRHTWYTLTDRRAFIATDAPLLGRRLKSYPIERGTVLSYDAGNPATIHFAHVMRRTKNGSSRSDIGFERIAEGPEVYGLMRQIQRGEMAAEENGTDHV